VDYDAHLLHALEPSQLTSATREPLPRKALGRGAVLLLVVLRIYVVVAVALVCYAFVRALIAPGG
jgi:hypothetical protein